MIKILWNNRGIEEATWENEEQMKIREDALCVRKMMILASASRLLRMATTWQKSVEGTLNVIVQNDSAKVTPSLRKVYDTIN
ncbi:hypothetical protein E6C27_scaffold36G001690 [Cucumis melo var. makuwa]|uniref:Chromo domain-containing protein n=1 Tax=Cucumis melo var. makuwa TaxID=1194695 RepID=A0A5A7T4R4_CUCMM|nr:hypothetical protein E6C27_scaffold36G001690 [Cucumis melo var. makuwa]